MEARRKPQAFAAAGVAIYILNFNALFFNRAALKFRVRLIQSDSSWLLQHTLFSSCDSHPIPASKLIESQCCSGRGASGFVLARNPHRASDDDRGDALGLVVESSMKHERMYAS